MTAVAATVGARHVGLSLVLGDRTEAVTVASDPVVTAVQNAEFILGEGPVHDVTAAENPVVVDAVALPRRWSRFAPEVARFGVCAVAAASRSTRRSPFCATTHEAPAQRSGTWHMTWSQGN